MIRKERTPKEIRIRAAIGITLAAVLLLLMPWSIQQVLEPESAMFNIVNVWLMAGAVIFAIPAILIITIILPIIMMYIMSLGVSLVDGKPLGDVGMPPQHNKPPASRPPPPRGKRVLTKT